MIIAITGTPGTGKTTLSRKLADKLGFRVFDVNEYIRCHDDVIIRYDEERDTKIIDEKKLIKSIHDFIMVESIDNVVIDSHLAHYLPKKIIDKCIVLSCDLTKLKERLIERDYNDLKIKENLEAETFDTILQEAEDMGHDIIHIDTSKKFSVKEIISKL